MQTNRTRGGKLRYVDSTLPEDYIPDFGDINPHNILLSELADAYGSDKGTLKHNYCDRYAAIIDGFCASKNNFKNKLRLDILEIGVACGASLRTWASYLPASKITGLDIRKECQNLCQDLPNVNIVIGDAINSAMLDNLLGSNAFDLVIDDGSHVSEHVTQSFQALWKRVKPGGVYAIEDLACTYNPEYALHIKNTFGISVTNDRNTVLHLVDFIFRSCDKGKHGISSLTYDPQLLIIQKTV